MGWGTWLAHLVPCWLVDWWLWRAGRISQDTYLLYQVKEVFIQYVPLSRSSKAKQTITSLQVNFLLSFWYFLTYIRTYKKLSCFSVLASQFIFWWEITNQTRFL